MNLSQEQLAERSGLHTNYVGQVERGEKNLTLETLEKVVGGLHISLEELFRYIGPMEQKDALSQIIELLVERSSVDQEMVLRILISIFGVGGQEAYSLKKHYSDFNAMP
ncbi:helix-turn-helix domain-containing protein [Paenibacillus rhizoplanae]